MALTVETGSGSSNSESYSSVSDADSYIANWHGSVSDWDTASTTDKEVALRRGTRYVDTFNFRGVRLNESQALDWPRDGVGIVDGQTIDPGEMPDRVKNAAIEAALKSVQGKSLFPNHDGGTITRERKTVGPITREFGYANPRTQKETFEDIEALLRPFTVSGNGSTNRVFRAFA